MYKSKLILLIVIFFTLFVVSYGVGASDVDTFGCEKAWVGVWDIVTEDGRTPAENGYNSLVLALTPGAFSSVFDSDNVTCAWTGANTSTPTTLTITTDAATGPPCGQAVGKTRTAQLTLSANGNILTLDWTAAPMGTLQVYRRHIKISDFDAELQYQQ
jgi:hypothetical protein